MSVEQQTLRTESREARMRYIHELRGASKREVQIRMRNASNSWPKNTGDITAAAKRNLAYWRSTLEEIPQILENYSVRGKKAQMASDGFIGHPWGYGSIMQTGRGPEVDLEYESGGGAYGGDMRTTRVPFTDEVINQMGNEHSALRRFANLTPKVILHRIASKL